MQVGSRRVLDLTYRDWAIHSSCSSSILLNCCNSTPSLHASLTIIRCLSLPRGALLTFGVHGSPSRCTCLPLLRWARAVNLLWPLADSPKHLSARCRFITWPLPVLAWSRIRRVGNSERQWERESSALFSSSSTHTFLPLPSLLWTAAA